MKLTRRTMPQIKDFQCDKCKFIFCHKDMYDDNWCNGCYEETRELAQEFINGK